MVCVTIKHPKAIKEKIAFKYDEYHIRKFLHSKGSKKLLHGSNFSKLSKWQKNIVYFNFIQRNF